MATEPMPLDSFEEIPVVQSFEITRSPSISKLVTALAKAQLKYKPILKQNENAAFERNGKKSYYADLATYIDATQEALASEELVVMQWPTISLDAKSMTLVSILAHSSGEWYQGKITLPALGRDGFTAQTCGSSITYGRRYTYAAITGCAAEDDDGNQAAGRGSADAAQAVAAKKIADFKAKKEYQPAPTTLFYVWPEKHNGNYAEFMNYKEYAAGLDQVAAEGLRKVIAPFASKNLSKIGSPIIPHDQMQSLLEKLAGDCGIEVHELKANREPGSDA